MRNRERTGAGAPRWLVLLAALGAVVGLAGCKSLSPEEANAKSMAKLSALVRAEVDDSTRADEIIVLLDRYQADVAELVRKRADRERALIRTNADYDTTRADLEALYERIGEDTRVVVEKMAEAHQALAAMVTEEEWRAIAKKRKKPFFSIE